MYGTVTETRQTFAPASGVIRFQPVRFLKGTLPGEVEVYLGPSRGGAISSVDYTAVVIRGEAHTLYLRSAGSGAWETNACSGSHVGAPTADETAFFGTGSSAPPAAPKDNTLLVLGAVGIAVIAMAAIVLVLAPRSGRPLDVDHDLALTRAHQTRVRSSHRSGCLRGGSHSPGSRGSRRDRRRARFGRRVRIRCARGRSERRSPTRSRRGDANPRTPSARCARHPPTPCRCGTPLRAPCRSSVRSACDARRPSRPSASFLVLLLLPALVLNVQLGTPLRDPVVDERSGHPIRRRRAVTRNDGSRTRASPRRRSRRRETSADRTRRIRGRVRPQRHAGLARPRRTHLCDASRRLIPYNVRYRRGYVPRRLFAPDQRSAASPGKGHRIECVPTSLCISFPRPPTKNG